MRKGAPFAGYEDFDACVAAHQDKDDPEAYCGKIKHQVEGKTAANPYSPSNNPYTPGTPGTPDDVHDGPPIPEPVQTVPMTTRPRQMPGGADEVDPALTPEEEVVLASLGMIPLRCASTNRKFSARVSPGLICVCGKRDYDLDDLPMRRRAIYPAGFKPTHIVSTIDDNEIPVQRLEGSGGFESAEGEYFREDSPDVMEIRKITRRMPRRKLAMEFDRQFDQRINIDVPMDELEENDQFAEPFIDDAEFKAEVDSILGDAGGHDDDELEVESHKESNLDGWEKTRGNVQTYPGLSENLAMWSKADGNVRYSVIEGPMILGDERFIWSVSNLYGDELANGASGDRESAQHQAMHALDALVDQLALFGSRKARDIYLDIRHANPRLGVKSALKLTQAVLDRYSVDLSKKISTGTKTTSGTDGNTTSHTFLAGNDVQVSYTT